MMTLLGRRVLLESLSYIYIKNYAAISLHRPPCCICPNIVQACQSARAGKTNGTLAWPSREVQDFLEHRPIFSDFGQTALQVYGCNLLLAASASVNGVLSCRCLGKNSRHLMLQTMGCRTDSHVSPFSWKNLGKQVTGSRRSWYCLGKPGMFTVMHSRLWVLSWLN